MPAHRKLSDRTQRGPRQDRRTPPFTGRWAVYDCRNCNRYLSVRRTIPEFMVEVDCPECDALVMPVVVSKL